MGYIREHRDRMLSCTDILSRFKLDLATFSGDAARLVAATAFTVSLPCIHNHNPHPRCPEFLLTKKQKAQRRVAEEEKRKVDEEAQEDEEKREKRRHLDKPVCSSPRDGGRGHGWGD
jgi:hypothetical protein